MTNQIPSHQHAVQFTGVNQSSINRDKDVDAIGSTQILVRIEACGICSDDVGLLNTFDKHPRKGTIVGGLNPDQLAAIPSYHPADMPVVPGHEPVGVIVAVGEDVKQHHVGERVLFSSDYPHLPTRSSNAALGFTFDGALQEYTSLDERVILDPEGTSFLIPVSDKPSASAIALIEPWAEVEAAYAWEERQTLREGGKLLVVLDQGRQATGVAELSEESRPAWSSTIGSQDLANVDKETFDDIIYFGSDPDVIESLEPLLGWNGLLSIILGGEHLSRPVAVDVGRVHHDRIRYLGTRGDSAVDSYRSIPATPKQRPGDIVAIIGAGSPTGVMHVVRSVVSGTPDLTIDAIDTDDSRLARLEEIVAPLAQKHHVVTAFHNSSSVPLEPGYTYATVALAEGQLVQDSLQVMTAGGIINVSADFPVGTSVELDVEKLVGDNVYLVGTSGSRIRDMVVLKQLVEDGLLDTNISLWAVTGLAGVDAALTAIEDGTSAGNIMVYPQLHDLELTPLSQLREKFPIVAEEMRDGIWNRAAERLLLRLAADK